jgi:hypothetical protein
MPTKNSVDIVLGAKETASAAINKVSSSLGRLAGEVGAVKTVLGGLAAGGVALAFRNIVNGLDALEESAQSAGVAVETLSSLRYAASFAGLGAEDLDDALKKLNVKLADAAGGGKDAVAAFKAIGLEFKNTSGQLITTDEALAEIADRFASFRDGPEKAALAIEIFGKSGAKLIPFLNGGREGMARLREEAAKLGIVVGGEAAAAASKLADQLDRIKASGDAGWRALASQIIPPISDLIEKFEAATKASKGFWEALSLARTPLGPGNDPAEALARVNEEIAKYQKARARFADTPLKITKEIDPKLAELARERAFLQELQRNFALKNAPGQGYNNGQTDRDTRPRAPVIDKKDGKPEKLGDDTAYSRYMNQLEQRLIKTQELTAVQEAQYMMESGALGDLSQQMKEATLATASKIDQDRERVELEKQVAKFMEDQQRAAEKQTKTFEDLAGISEERARSEQRAAIAVAKASGLYSNEQIERAWDAYYGINQQLKETENLAQDVGLVFESAFSRMVAGGNKFSNVLKSLGQDLLQLAYKRLILKPLEDMIGNILGGLFKTGAASGGWTSGFDLPFGGGRAGGGSVMAGTSYLVGESGPERFVPATGGSIVPAGAGGVSVVINQQIDSRSDAATIRAAGAMAVAEAERRILASMQRRGAFA